MRLKSKIVEEEMDVGDRDEFGLSFQKTESRDSIRCNVLCECVFLFV